MTNAVSLNSATFTAARMVGPAVAAGVIAGGGLDACFFANALSFLAVIAALVRMREGHGNLRSPVQSAGS